MYFITYLLKMLSNVSQYSYPLRRSFSANESGIINTSMGLDQHILPKFQWTVMYFPQMLHHLLHTTNAAL